MLKQRYTLSHPSSATLRRHPDAVVLRFGDSPVGWDDGLVSIHRAANGALLHSVGPDLVAAEAAGAPRTARGGLPVTCLRWRPSPRSVAASAAQVLLAGGSDGTLRHIDASTGELCGASVVEERNEIHSLDCRADGGAFATGGKDGAVRVYDEETRQLVCKLTGNASAGAEHFHDTTLSSPLARRGVALDRFESLSAAGPRITSSGAGHSNRVYAVAWHPSCWGRVQPEGGGSFGNSADPAQENIIASGSVDNTVNVWDVRLRGSVRSFFDCNIAGDGLVFSSDGRFMFTASLRNQEQLQVRVWLRSSWLLGPPPTLFYLPPYPPNSPPSPPSPIRAGVGLGGGKAAVQHSLDANGSGTG